ncbi:hypothetical protein FHG87_006423 [Trinorchestia longiramus]|nr:hypothetical protein FHG87_006423 [Trinorchestia longiramus]
MQNFMYVLACVLVITVRHTDSCISLTGKPPNINYISAPLGPSFPNDTVYRSFRASLYHLALANHAGGYVNITCPEECRLNAASKGAQMFSYQAGVCIVANLNFPLCKSRTGNISVYVQDKFLSDGTVDDNAVLGDRRSSLFGENPQVSFRIQNPTILQFPEFYTPLTFRQNEFPATNLLLPNNFVVLTNEGTLATVSDRVLVDPQCYTESSCGVPFFTSSQDVPETPLIFHNFCGKRLTLRYGNVFHLVSHDRIGCEYFPDEYPDPFCPINYKGFAPVKIRATLVNFAGDDQCDGFTLKVISFDNLGVKNKTNLCDSHETEITALGGKGRIIFGGSAITKRNKYGFIITISY